MVIGSVCPALTGPLWKSADNQPPLLVGTTTTALSPPVLAKFTTVIWRAVELASPFSVTEACCPTLRIAVDCATVKLTDNIFEIHGFPPAHDTMTVPE